MSAWWILLFVAVGFAVVGWIVSLTNDEGNEGDDWWGD